MPQKGQASITIGQNNLKIAREYFDSNKKELVARGISSIPLLYQNAMLTFIGETEEPSVRPSIRAELLRGFADLVESNFFSSNYIYSLGFILNESIQGIPHNFQASQSESYRNRLQQFLKLRSELGDLTKSNELLQLHEKRLSQIVNEIVNLMSEYLRFAKELKVNSPNSNMYKLTKALRGFYARYLSMVLPFATIVLVLTGNSGSIYSLSQQLDHDSSESILDILFSSSVQKFDAGVSK